LKEIFPNSSNYSFLGEGIMSNVAIVTDSTAYLPKDLVEKYSISVAPQVLIFGEDEYRDGVDIQPSEFYTRLATAEVMPTTSQVAVTDFKAIFEKLHAEGNEILAVLVSDQLSKTSNSADLAKQMIPAATIEIVNSESVAMALGFQVLAAARTAENGGALADCKAAALAAKEKTGVVFAVDTLEFLHRGGRIGGASRFLGTALKLKPLLEVSNGKVEPIERVRTSKKAHARLLEIISERVAGLDGEVHLAALHANAVEESRELLARASKQLGAIETIYSEVSPVVGTHCGPGTIGIAYMVD
jgi:DegV family protein with EDD domain